MKKKTVWVKPQDLTADELMGIVALAKRNLVERNGCLEWGTIVTSGNRHRCRLGTDIDGNDRVVRTQDVLLYKSGLHVPIGGKYIRTCNNPRCMNPQHLTDGGVWSKYNEQNGASLYEQDKKMATEMMQYGWSYQDVIMATSMTMYAELIREGVPPAPGLATREPLTYEELLRVAEALRAHNGVVKHVSVLADDAKIDFDKLMKNGQAVKALRRRMHHVTKSDEVVWLLTELCKGLPMQKACEVVGKDTVFGTTLIGACYG